MMDSLREMFAMIELELRRLSHDRTELYTRAIQPILWLAVYGTVMSHVKAIPTDGIPYLDYITPGVLLQSTIFVSVFYGLTIVWERETGILKKLLVAPASRYATVIGRSIASGVRAIFQVLIIIPVALLIGVNFLFNPLYFIMAILIIFFVSNSLYPIKLMPPILQYFAFFNPLTYAVDAVRGLMISGDISNLLPDIAAIAIFDVIMFAAASVSFRKIIE